MKASSFPLLFFIALFVAVSCKKSSSGDLSPFAQSLRSACATPFIGHGDSSNFYLPTAFTPNGDGIDDYYGLTLGDRSFSSFSLKIYDSNGLLVNKFDSASSRIWDGTDMNTGSQSTKYKFYVKVNYTTKGHITDSGGTYVFLLSTDPGHHCIKVVPADTAKYEFPDQFMPGTGFVPGFTSFETYCN